MTDFVDSEMQLPETPFEARRYRVRYRCAECGHEWKSRWLNAVPKKDPSCPNPSCQQVRELRQTQKELERLRAMILEGKPPGIIGSNLQVKAVDYTAEAIMQDYNFTNLKDNIREGESMVPKLPPGPQAAADSYFKEPAGPVPTVDFGTNRRRMIQAKQLNAIAERAKRGMYRNRAVNPTEVIPEAAKHRSPLQSTGIVRNPNFRG